LTPEQLEAFKTGLQEMEFLKRYLQKGVDRINTPLSIGDYIKSGGDAVISWDLFQEDYIQEIETRQTSELPMCKNVLELLKSELKKTLADPLTPEKPTHLRYGISVIDKLIKLIEIRLQVTKSSDKRELTVKEIALLYFYLDEPITPKNVAEIAEKYGYRSNKPYQYYLEYSLKQNRTGDPGSKAKVRNQIKRIENI